MKKDRHIKEISFEEKSKISHILVTVADTDINTSHGDIRSKLEEFSPDIVLQYYDAKKLYFLRLSESCLISEEIDVMLSTGNFLFLLNNIIDCFGEVSKIGNEELHSLLMKKRGMKRLVANVNSGLLGGAPWYNSKT